MVLLVYPFLLLSRSSPQLYRKLHLSPSPTVNPLLPSLPSLHSPSFPFLLLIPQLNLAIPSTRNNLTGLMWQPDTPDTDSIVRLEPLVHLRRLPVPYEATAVRVPGNQIGVVGGEVGLARVPGHHVTLKHLLAVVAQLLGGEYGDLIVHGLASEPFTGAAERARGDGVHAGVGDVLAVDGDVPVPHTQGLVVRGGDETVVALDEGDRVNRAQMPVVFLEKVRVRLFLINVNNSMSTREHVSTW